MIVPEYRIDAPLFSRRFIDDPKPPDYLYVSKDFVIDDWPTVGIIGSRRATPYGRKVAHSLGKQLSRSGVVVVSGLATGIDGCAHEGALDNEEFVSAPPVAVVGGGIDVVYPPRNYTLWQRMVDEGVIISEYPSETPTERWRFPERNRIIAALSDVLVVVESTIKSGTRHTVDAAIERSKPVLAVPGPITSKQSEGTNQLLREGLPPVLDVGDVLVSLALARPDLPSTPIPRKQAGALAVLPDELVHIYEAIDVVPSTLSAISQRAHCSFLVAAKLLDELVRLGRIAAVGDGWVRV